jgi:tetratricopeptide (TPR) repeat protein
MTTHAKNCFGVIVALTIGLVGALANEPNDSTMDLTFEVQSESLGPFSAPWAYQAGGPYVQACALKKPPYAAGIPLVGPAGFLVRPGSARGHQFPGFASEGKRLSKGLFDAQRRGGPVPQRYRPGDDPNGPEQLLLYAMTLDDAKAMAEAYVEFVMRDYRRVVERQRELIAKREQMIAEAEERLGEMERAIETSGPALEALKQKVPYRTEGEAAEAIAELDRMLNAAQVDTAGIKAKLEAIQDHLQTRRFPYDEAIRVKLEAMFVEESVALEGAEARQKKATQLRADANRFLDLQKSVTAAKRNIGAARELPGRHREEIEQMRRKLEVLMLERPLVADQKIAIYPVEWTGEAGDPIEMGPMN